MLRLCCHLLVGLWASHLLLFKMTELVGTTSKYTPSNMIPVCYEVCGSRDNIGIAILPDCSQETASLVYLLPSISASLLLEG